MVSRIAPEGILDAGGGMWLILGVILGPAGHQRGGAFGRKELSTGRFGLPFWMHCPLKMWPQIGPEIGTEKSMETYDKSMEKQGNKSL